MKLLGRSKVWNGEKFRTVLRTVETLHATAVELHLKGFLRTFGAGESAYTFCEPADEVLPAHHNGDTAGSLEGELIWPPPSRASERTG
jgi:hypothetical protein